MKVREINANVFSVESIKDCRECVPYELCTTCIDSQEALRLRMLKAARNCESAKLQLRGEVIEVIF